MARESRVPNWTRLLVAGASASVVALAIAGHFEGRSLPAYRDIGGVLTICDGDTHNVRPGEVDTPSECDARLREQMAVADAGVGRCIRRPMSRGQRAAFDDAAYNLGVARFCRSSIARRFNAGDTKGACAALLWYDKADGRVLRGLRLRRQEEYKLCEAGQ